MRRLLQIAPRFPPLVDGVGDYADRLATEFNREAGVESIFLATDSKQPGGHNIVVLSDHRAETLTRALNTLRFDAILLHYSGYGYDSSGAPSWLVHGLEQFTSAHGRKLAIFFHEVWASGPPWEKAFFLQPLQKRVIRRLQAIATQSLTSTPKMQRLLTPHGPPVTLLPIPSIVPTALEIHPRPSQGPLQIAAFGQEHTRFRSLRAHERLLKDWAAAGQIKSLTLIGKDATSAGSDYQLASSFLSEGQLRLASNASVPEITRLLSTTDLSLSFYPAHLVTKLTTIMAAFAQGCPVLVPAYHGDERDLFDSAPPLLFAPNPEAAATELLRRRANGSWNDTARQAYAWYQKHADWRTITDGFSAALGLAALTAQPEALLVAS